MSSQPANSRPRSLADDLRTRDDAALRAMLIARPDLVHPMPNDIGQLAVRATTGPSVNAALEGLNAIELAICEVLAALPDPTSITAIRDGVQHAQGFDDAVLERVVSSLVEVGLVWGTHEELHLVRVAREAFGAYPCELAQSMSDSRAQVKLYEQDSQLALDELQTMPEQAQDIAMQLAWSPVGTMRNAQRKVTREKAKTALEYLLVRDFIVPTSDTTVIMPREVALAIRQGQLIKELPSEDGDAWFDVVDSARIDSSGAHMAIDFVTSVETLLEEWSVNPPTQLRGGGVAVRDLVQATQILRLSQHQTALIIEVAYAAGLVAAEVNGAWLPTPHYDRWLGLDDASRWVNLATAWRLMNRAPHLIAQDTGERITALSPGVERTFIEPLRNTVIEVYLSGPDCSAASVQTMTSYLDWHRPRRSSLARARAITAILEEADFVGVLGAGALTSMGRALYQDAQPEAALSSLLPPPVDHIIVQSDLTALAPGRLLPIPRRTMNVIADVESSGVATTYRFTEQSIRRALDQGQSSQDILTFLAQLSRTPLPQPLTYLIEDVARKHGHLRVGVATVYLRCDDEQLINHVQADRRLTSLKLRSIAPGVVVSSASPDEVLEKLRETGYAPVPESADGAVLIHRPDARRTGSRTLATQTQNPAATHRLVNAALRILRTNEATAIQKSGTGNAPRVTTDETIVILESALGLEGQVLMGYADKMGRTSELTVEPLTLSGGFLTAFDVQSNEVRTFTVARITGAVLVEMELVVHESEGATP